MFYTKHCWIIGISILLFISCSDSDDQGEISALIPYKTGNSWTYESTTQGIQRKNVDMSTTKIGDYVDVKGNKGYRIAGSCGSFIVRNDENGNVVEVGGYSGNNTLFAPSVKYKKNAIKGEKWLYNVITEDCSYYDDYTSGLFEKRSVFMTCIHTDTLIQTAKGLFKCKAYSYSPDGRSLVYIDYVSDGIGRVKTEHYEDGLFAGYNELVDYKLN